MSNTSLPASHYITKGIQITIVLAVCIFGFKSYQKFQAKKDLLAALSIHTSESASYEQFYQEDAHENILQAMYHLHNGVSTGKTPTEIINEVMAADEKEWFSSEEPEKLPLRKELIRDALINNYNHCLKLGIFEDRLNLKALSQGELPTINSGPSEGEKVIILNVISSRALPGAEKLLPNMIITPPFRNKDQRRTFKLTEFDITRAKNLAQQLSRAGLIEKPAYNTVIKYYEKFSK